MIRRIAPYRNDVARTILTHEFGLVEIPAGFEWYVGAGWIILPRWMVSDALKEAACVHDYLYRGPRTAPRLRRVDHALVEVYWREGGSVSRIPFIYAAIRGWAWKTLRKQQRLST